jgi:hypothetical protein
MSEEEAIVGELIFPYTSLINVFWLWF